MKINEVIDVKQIEKLYRQQQRQQRLRDQEKISFFVRFHVYPDLANTVGVYWLTPDQQHFSYQDAANNSQAIKLSTTDIIREFGQLIYRLGNYFNRDRTEYKKIEVQIPSNLSKASPEIQKAILTWKGRIEVGGLKNLILFRNISATNTKQKPTSSSVQHSVKTRPNNIEIAQTFKQIFSSNPGLAQELRKKRNANVDAAITRIIIDNWGEDTKFIANEIGDYLGVKT